MPRHSAQLRFAALAAAAVTLAAPGARPALVRADELTDFEQARVAYDRAQYRQAIVRFEALVGGETPRLRSAPLVLESRKYLAASYLFDGAPDKAEAQFERLLRADPAYQLDPAAFPRDVHRLFASVRDRLQEEAREDQEQEQERFRAEQERQAEQERLRQRVVDLEAIARQEVVREHNSRWVAMVPFGAGQFQNGHQRLGLTLAVTQGVLAATFATTFFLHQRIRATELPGHTLPGCSEAGQSFCDQLQRRERAYRYTNWLSGGLLAGLVVYGIIDAQLRFVPQTETTRTRELPPEREPERPSPGPQLGFGVGPGGAELRLLF
jgi:tetratricopeptide (TPR) repeat protein